MAGAIGPAMPAVNAVQQKQVLVIYSTRRDVQIVAVGERELPRILEKELGSVDYYSEYMDDARFPEASYTAAFRSFLRLKYSGQRFDAVVTVQDAALELVRGIRDELFAGVPLVFFATDPVTGHLENATGLVARLDFSGTLDLIAALQPETRNVYIVTGSAPSDKEYERLAREQSLDLRASPGAGSSITVRVPLTAAPPAQADVAAAAG